MLQEDPGPATLVSGEFVLQVAKELGGRCPMKMRPPRLKNEQLAQGRTARQGPEPNQNRSGPTRAFTASCSLTVPSPPAERRPVHT